MNKNSAYVDSSYGASFYIPEDIIIKESRNMFLENMVITKAGYFKNAKGHEIKREGINEYIMLYCIDGNGWIQIEDKLKAVCKGDLVFLESKIPHKYGASKENPWSIYWVHFVGKGISDILYRLEISKQSPILHVGERTDLIMLMNEVLKTLSNGYSFSDLFHASTCLQNFFSNIFQIRTYSHMHSKNSINLESLIHFMRQNIREVYTLEQLADNMCMSKYHFARRFKERTGYSPIEYFTRMKIQKACELLETTSIEIKEISGYLSFCNPYYFSEVFKKITGYSPRDYRNIHGFVKRKLSDN
jgi:Transcriptional regulator containing an amidase domain and an AraC-type DNA-binding HTH domain